MAIAETAFAGGILFGLASALHCSTMCGGVACGALLLLGAQNPADRFRQLALLQVGRVASYAMIGGVAATIGTTVLSLHSGLNFQATRWAAAVSLIWMGLAMAGMMPRIAALDSGIAGLAGIVATATRPLRNMPTAGPLALGMVWGLNACPMVYGAAFTASLTGSVSRGAIFMTGFGIGTIPAVLIAAGGVTLARQAKLAPEWRMAAGAAIALLGFASIYLPLPAALGFCLSK
jgi:sulfite exporter TauE/SafE